MYQKGKFCHPAKDINSDFPTMLPWHPEDLSRDTEWDQNVAFTQTSAVDDFWKCSRRRDDMDGEMTTVNAASQATI